MEDIETLKQLYNSGYIYVHCGGTVDKAIANLLTKLNELQEENRELKKVIQDKDEWIKTLEREGGY